MPNQGTSLEIEQHESSGFFWVYRTVGWWPWLVVALGLLLLALVHATLIRGSIERDLQARARAVLDQQGADQVRADFVGRDGRLSGELPAEIDAQELADQVKSIDGARVVTADFGGAGASPSAEGTGPTVSAQTAGGSVTLSGQVVDQATADRLEKAAVEAFGEGKVANELTVAPGLSGEGIEEFAALLKPMQQTVAAGGQATARLADGDLALSGSLPQNADTAPLLQSASGVADATGGTVRDNLTGATAESSAATGASEPSAATVEQELAALPNITFATDTAQLTADGQAVVRRAADVLKANPQAVVAINGYTDDMGDEGFNLQLSKDRAAAVRSALASMGIAADRMTSDGFGENNPKVPNTSAANRAQNRRVEFVVS
ncbi:MAG: hypothetical protein CSA58_02760 [Micrococcales bacterium]|nr:MAG: hypothetical protein CSA58_02760 [Micrococcales bacterium]